MSKICWFLGIRIEMGIDDHPVPHFHAIYEDLEPNPEAAYAIETLEVIEGALPKLAHGFVLEWMDDHRKELLEDWQRVKQGLPLPEIEALEGTF
ncbi:MAG TPA: DUF4160 domain-containing protein [Candidatus Kapabacteria bacterium]|nr:DUF4160 domain-containing protein [Candidatus Kapabacteria bacterium]